MTRPSGIRINWSLLPPSWKCPDTVTSVGLPSTRTSAWTTDHPLRAFKGRVARLPIRISYRDGKSLIWNRTITWRGTMVLKRVPKR